MDLGRAWILNLDADDELARPGSRPSDAAALRMRAMVERLQGLVPHTDRVIDPSTPPDGAVGFEGRAFCPTPGAIALIQRAGAMVPHAPSIDVLRVVNHRRFAAELGQELPHARYCTTMAEVTAQLEHASPTGIWVLKRPHGFAGRGRRRIVAPLDEGARSFVVATLRSWGGVQVEPWVTRNADFALHGFIERARNVTLGEPTTQRTDEAGRWIESHRARNDELSGGERESLFQAAHETAGALTKAGYFGPFGIDAFRYEHANTRHFLARCEINARYTMGWASGMGDRRPDLETLTSR